MHGNHHQNSDHGKPGYYWPWQFPGQYGVPYDPNSRNIQPNHPFENRYYVPPPPVIGHGSYVDHNANRHNDAVQGDKAPGDTGNKGKDKEWTSSQDAILRAMREGDESWSTIGNALGRGKKECRRRWKELSADGNLGTSQPDTTKERSRNRRTGAESKSTITSEKSDSNTEILSPEDQYAELNRRQAHVVAALSRAFDIDLDSDLVVQPGSVFSDLDCKLLTILVTKHRRQKWLELQAEFFNTTGRMVDARLLESQWNGGEDTVRSGASFPRHDRRLLRDLHNKREADKWLVLKAEFFNGAGRMIDVQIFKSKLGEKVLLA